MQNLVYLGAVGKDGNFAASCEKSELLENYQVDLFLSLFQSCPPVCAHSQFSYCNLSAYFPFACVHLRQGKYSGLDAYKGTCHLT